MARRLDAGVTLFEFATELRRRFQALADERTVWTIGHVALSPGAPSIIPGEAELLLQFRDQSEARLTAMWEALEALVAETTAAGGVQVLIDDLRSPIVPTDMDLSLIHI